MNRIPEFRNGPVPTYDDLPMDDPVGSVRRAGDQLYHRVDDSIARDQAWRPYGSTTTNSTGGITVQHQGTEVEGGPFTTLNFTGNFFLTDHGSGILTINSPPPPP